MLSVTFLRVFTIMVASCMLIVIMIIALMLNVLLLSSYTKCHYAERPNILMLLSVI
jgi:hypothetical protein